MMKEYKDNSGLAYSWLEANMRRVLRVVLFAWLGVWELLLEGRDDLDLGRRLVRGTGPELAGIMIAAVMINALADRRQTEQLKAQLIRQMGSRHNEVADTAVKEVAYRGNAIWAPPSPNGKPNTSPHTAAPRPPYETQMSPPTTIRLSTNP